MPDDSPDVCRVCGENPPANGDGLCADCDSQIRDIGEVPPEVQARNAQRSGEVFDGERYGGL